MAQLFESLELRSITLRNRIGMSPMCMYSCARQDGQPGAWHAAHLAARALGGAGLILTEATAVEPAGRISACDTGLWDDAQIAAWQPVTALLQDIGAVAGVQLAHAGRKAGTAPPWDGGAPYPDRAQWPNPAPTALPFGDGWPMPHALTTAEIAELVRRWSAAARRALAAGFQVLELHAAHGYLLHQFLSPLSNQRQDEYGGSLDKRLRFPLEVAAAVRACWPEHLPMLVRISATDWVEGGWDIEQSVEFASRLRARGIDLIDCSSGGAAPQATPPAVGPGYQVEFAARIKREAGIATAAVGLITDAAQAQRIVETGQADLVLLGRELLRNPHWPLQAAADLQQAVEWPRQYLRAKS